MIAKAPVQAQLQVVQTLPQIFVHELSALKMPLVRMDHAYAIPDSSPALMVNKLPVWELAYIIEK